MNPLESERPASGLTAGDALSRARPHEPADFLPPADDSRRPARPVNDRTPVEEVLVRMDEARTDSLPVLDEEGRFVGDVTQRDILESLLARHADLMYERRVLNLAIERQRLALEATSSRMTALNDYLAELELLLLRTANEGEYFRRAIELLRSLLGARIGVIALRSEDGRWALLGHAGLDEVDAERLQALPVERGPLGVVAASARALRLEDLDRHPGTAGLSEFHPGVRALLAVPFVRGDHVEGGLYLCDQESGGPFREEHVSLAVSFARALMLMHALWRVTPRSERIPSGE